MEIKLNLASQPEQEHRGARPGLLLGCAVLALLLAFNIYGVSSDLGRISQLGSHLQELEQQAADLEGIAPGVTPAAVAAQQQELAHTRAILDADRFRWTGLLDRFEALLPDAVSIRTIQPDYRQRSLRLNCVARDVAAMNLFLDRLLASPDLNQAFLQRHAENSGDARRRQTQVDFSLTVREAF